MNCILFRHGIAEEREEWKGNDADRPLTEKGAKRIIQTARGLLSLGVIPTHFLTSPLTRAHETALLLQKILGGKVTVRSCDELLPGASPEKILPLLQALPSQASAICVGHEPHLGEAAGLLLFGKPAPGLRFKKAGACLIEMPNPIKAGHGRLQWWLKPGQLRMMGKSSGDTAD